MPSVTGSLMRLRGGVLGGGRRLQGFNALRDGQPHETRATPGEWMALRRGYTVSMPSVTGSLMRR